MPQAPAPHRMCHPSSRQCRRRARWQAQLAMEPRAHRIVGEACKAQAQREGVHGEMRLRTVAPRIVAACVTVRAAQGGRSMGSCSSADSSAVDGAAPAAASCFLLLR